MSNIQPILNLSEAVQTKTKTISAVPTQDIVNKRKVQNLPKNKEQCASLKISVPNLGK